jgi:hypothetical protein
MSHTSLQLAMRQLAKKAAVGADMGIDRSGIEAAQYAASSAPPPAPLPQNPNALSEISNQFTKAIKAPGAGDRAPIHSNSGESFLSRLSGGGADLLSRAGKKVNDARLSAGSWLGENVLYPGAVWADKKRNEIGGAIGEAAYSAFHPQDKSPPASIGGAAGGGGAAGASGESPSGSPLDISKLISSPYAKYIAGGVGTAGVAGLLYAMHRRNKKKRQEEEMQNMMALEKGGKFKKAEEADAYYNKQPEKMNLYDAGESVKNMPVKKTEESHKECTPGEFSMNKEGTVSDGFNNFMNKLVSTPTKDNGMKIMFNRLGLGGALTGGLYGAMTAPKGKMLRRALTGAGVGGLTGLGAGAGASLGMNLGLGAGGGSGIGGLYTADDRSRSAFTGALGMLGGGLLTNSLANKGVKEMDLDDEEDTPKQANAGNWKSVGPAASFGQKISGLISPELIAPLAGAATGAGVGALSSKKNRLRNALIGAGIGGAGGGLAEYAMPGIGLGGKYRLEDMLTSPSHEKDINRGAEVGGLMMRNAIKNPGSAISGALNSKSPTPGLDMFYPNGPHGNK